MIVGDLPVGASGINQLVVFPGHRVRAGLAEHFSGVGDFLQGAVLMIVQAAVLHRTKYIDTVFTIVHAEFPPWGVETIAQVLVVG